MDGGGSGGADAAGGEQGLVTDIGDAGIHAGSGAAGRDRSVASTYLYTNGEINFLEIHEASFCVYN